MKLPLLIGLLLIAPSLALADGLDTTIHKSVYYERVSDEITRFFYDDHYYLADKHCPFKTIERVGQYDFQQQLFIGEFTDFDNRGRAILKGSYRAGRKDGDFKAYHPNGQLKWEVSFIQDNPSGLWKFYYPDGKPLLEVTYHNGERRILNFWNQLGKQRVTDGNGRYEFEVAADGYNEFGYVRYNRKGKILEGRPHGSWAIDYIFADGKKQNAGFEFYQHGKFVQGYEVYTDEEFFDAPRYHLTPFISFFRAETMIAKGCTIDEHEGFTGYLAEHLENWFEGEVGEIPDPLTIEFMISVKKNGEPGKIEISNTFDTKRYADLLLESLNEVTFWFPSYANGEYIDDTLTVTAEVFPDAVERKLRFFDVTIRREKGI